MIHAFEINGAPMDAANDKVSSKMHGGLSVHLNGETLGLDAARDALQLVGRHTLQRGLGRGAVDGIDLNKGRL